MIWFWDEPFSSLLVLLRNMIPPLQPMVPGLILAIWARWHTSRAIPGPVEPAIDGAGLASAILRAGGVSARLHVRKSGPLATFYDPGNRELRLSEAVAAGRSIESLGIAAHEAGHALQDVPGYWPSRARPPLVLGSRIAVVVAGMTLVAGLGMLNPDLTRHGATLFSAAAFTLLALLPVELDANRRCLAALPPDEAFGRHLEAFGRALDAAAWADLASTLPGSRRTRARPPHRRA